MSIVRSPRLFAPQAEDFAKVPPALDSWSTWSEADDAANRIALPEPPAWRSIAVTTRDQLVDLAEGDDPGLVDGLARLAEDAHRVALDAELADGVALADAVAELGDSVVWDGSRVVAVLRPLADGSIEVAHFAPTGFLDPIGGGR